MAPRPGRPAEPDMAAPRADMVRELAERGCGDGRVLDALGAVPREAFVPVGDRARAYADRPLPIGAGQTISQPHMVAVMLEALALTPADRLLEVGSGSGYAAAVASRLCASVVGVERIEALAAASTERLRRLGYDTVTVVVADGTGGWPPAAPYDAILVSAGGPVVPPALLEQLAAGGRLVMPVGGPARQDLVRLRRVAGLIVEERLGPVAFVPLVGAAGWPEPST